MTGSPSTANEVIAALGLQPHPEGGYFVETWRSDSDGRSPITSIYFLLERGKPSHWHRVDAAEIWNFHAGAPLRLEITEGTQRRDFVLGLDFADGQRPQATVPPGEWQRAETLGDWTLVGCAVGPGFQFATFELAPPDFEP